MQLGLQELLVGEAGFVLGDEGGREGATECILDDFVVFAGAQKHAN